MAPIEVISFPVGPLHPPPGGKGLVEGLGQSGYVRFGPRQFSLDTVPFGLDPLLLRLQQIDWQGVGVEGFEELLTLGIERGETGAVAFDFPLVHLAHPCQRFVEGRAYIRQVERPLVRRCSLAQLRDLDLHVCRDDPLLDLVGGQIRQAAAGALDPAEAGEVVIDAAAFAASLDEGDRFPAAAAQAALQEMPVLTIALARLGVGVEDALHPAEGVFVDQRLVATLVFNASVGDNFDVVLVPQQSGELGPRERAGGLFGSWPRSEATLLERGVQRVEGVRAGGVGGERPANVRGALRVDNDGTDLATVDDFSDVQVANRGEARRAAELGLAVQPLLDLGGEVERVVLRDGGEDAMRQSAGRRAVDALGGRYQLGARFHDFEQHVGVVAAVAGETIDFVDDDVGRRVAGFQPLQQPLQVRAVRVGGRLGRVDELLGDLGLKLSGLAAAVGPLGLDGVPLL